MSLSSLLIANRGEIAIRIARAAAELGIKTVAIFSEDDARSLHTRKVDEAQPLQGKGVAPYLDIEQIVAVAKRTGCDAIHPGYGFLAENAAFAQRCLEEGIVFVGPRPEILDLFGDKARARVLARGLGVPVVRGTDHPTSLEEAKEFFSSLRGGAMMIKAIAGGGGRGMRIVSSFEEIDEAFSRCLSEAKTAFGSGDVYVEQFIPRARHIEVQIIGDGTGEVSHLWERDCSLQRRHQKLVEIAPSPAITSEMREQLTAAAVRLAREVRYNSLGTFEFLVGADEGGEKPDFAFMEANARLQVEHTVTEEVTGVDLVIAQLELASGRTVAELGLRQDNIPQPRGFAVQSRINMETMRSDGTTRPSVGTLTAFEVPSGSGLRVDSCGYGGYATSSRFDSLLAKLVVHSSSSNFANAVAKAQRALGELRIEGVPTNVGFLQNLLQHPEFQANNLHTRFVDDHIQELAAPETAVHRRLYFEQATGPRLAGAKVDAMDPLAVLVHGKTGNGAPATPQTFDGFAPAPFFDVDTPEGTVAVKAPMQGTIVSISVQEEDFVRLGQQLLVMESMKMEHVISSEVSGVVRGLGVSEGDTVYEGHPLVFIEETEADFAETVQTEHVDLGHVRPDLAQVLERHAMGLDAARPGAVAKHKALGHRTARENIDDLCDPGSFVEYGPLLMAAQRSRRSLDDLMRNTPADGMIAGLGRINGELFDEHHSQCAVVSYDYTVLAGTQGYFNHNKKDRIFEVAARRQLPVVFFTEGGGGRPGDVDKISVSGVNVLAFHLFAKLSGLVPLVGVTAGRCFAGNAVLLGCCDLIIATADSNIGVGGPAMVEGGGLGVFTPEEIGPMAHQVPNGVVDIPVADEAEAVRVAKKYLSYFQGPIKEWKCADQRLLRGLIPENRLRAYDVRKVIDALADADSVLEIRRHWGHGIITSFVRIEGRPVGVIANNPVHLGGAIDSPAGDKGARFIQLCDAFDIPILYLCDTPGLMVGPEAEKEATVRHATRMFVNGANVTVPYFGIILRKAYGLGILAMLGGSSWAPDFTVAWPTAEFGGMGLEGSVKLGFRKELAAISDPLERKATYERMVAAAYERGKAVNAAPIFEFDDVIDPADSRKWIVAGLRAAPLPPPRTGKKRPNVDTW